jgi:Spy/CpxP family protein refolding chaperone
MKRTLIALAILTISVTGLSYGVASWCVHRSTSPSVADVNDTAWLKRELQLTDAQGAQVDGLDKEFRAKLNQCCDAHCAARLTLSKELARPQVDLAEASACVDRMAGAQSQSERDTLDHILRVRAVLTREQQQRYATLVSQQVCMAGPMGMKSPAP